MTHATFSSHVYVGIPQLEKVSEWRQKLPLCKSEELCVIRQNLPQEIQEYE